MQAVDLEDEALGIPDLDPPKKEIIGKPEDLSIRGRKDHHLGEEEDTLETPTAKEGYEGE